jgi:hypothetical protein
MFWGFLFTAGAVAVLVIWGLVEIFRVDRIIEKVDRELAEKESAEQ